MSTVNNGNYQYNNNNNVFYPQLWIWISFAEHVYYSGIDVVTNYWCASEYSTCLNSINDFSLALSVMLMLYCTWQKKLQKSRNCSQKWFVAAHISTWMLQFCFFFLVLSPHLESPAFHYFPHLLFTFNYLFLFFLFPDYCCFFLFPLWEFASIIVLCIWSLQFF